MVVQSPVKYPATLTPMEPRAVLAIVDAIAEAGVTLAGVNGDINGGLSKEVNV